MTDTTPEAAQLVRELCARKTGIERLRMGASMFETARALVLASLPPGLPERELRRRLCARFYGELAEEIYGNNGGKSVGRITG